MAMLNPSHGATGFPQGMSKSQSMRHLGHDTHHNQHQMRSNTALTSQSQMTDPYQKVSYRQKGKKVDGSLIKGTTSAAFIKKSTGSIPSKQETIVYMHADSKKQGFGSNSERFQGIFQKPTTEGELPGPGSYLSEQNINYMLKKSDSFSRKGFGNGFISKYDRFKNSDVSMHSYFPGPGQYSASTHQDSLMQSTITSKFTEKYKNQNFSSVFMQHSNKSLRKTSDTPGPGSYNINKNPSNNQLEPIKPAAESVFKSGSQKSEYLNWNQEVLKFPAPGQYEFERDNLLKKTLSTYNIHKTTSNFKLPYNCKRVKVNVYDPFQNVEAMEQKVPGPGSYNVEKETIAYKNIEKLTSGMFSSMFQKPLQEPQSLSPLKTGEKQEIPGPGYYDLKLSGVYDKKAVSSSMFKSDSVREIINVKRGPGPAFYKQVQLTDNTKSYNTNIKSGIWL